MPKLTLVTSKNCYDCSLIKESINEIKVENPKLGVEELDVDSGKGKDIVDDLGIMSLPAILVNGQLYSTGFISKQDIVDNIIKKGE